MKVKTLVLGVGIFIVYLLMLSYGIEAFYPSPKYDAYCTGYDPGYPVKTYPVGGSCTFSQTLADQASQCSVQGGYAVYTYNETGCETGIKECNLCSKHYMDAQKVYDKRVFIIALIAGIITLGVGYGILSVEPVGSALMASGIGAILYGSIRNWQNLSDVLRFVLLVVALVLLIWIALRINKDRVEKKPRRKR